ncbi:hypothetical protein H920_11294 [Fukomys damarensis]|uniref:Uncharacterized protein n=1 Tax=Fukomys damarensis TaxID=885580 RepID=A0A091D5C4_FUKDA|nr:hypothetical protein H920_11294 [Fukomys damarensis]
MARASALPNATHDGHRANSSMAESTLQAGVRCLLGPWLDLPLPEAPASGCALLGSGGNAACLAATPTLVHLTPSKDAPRGHATDADLNIRKSCETGALPGLQTNVSAPQDSQTRAPQCDGLGRERQIPRRAGFSQRWRQTSRAACIVTKADPSCTQTAGLDRAPHSSARDSRAAALAEPRASGRVGTGLL